MDLMPYLARLQRDLLTSARAGGPEAVDLAEVLAAGVEPAARMLLQDAVVEAAAEVTTHLSPGSVEVRVRGQEVDLVVTTPAAPEPVLEPVGLAADTDAEDDGGTARLSLRLPERLKPRVEEAADAAGLSVNAWLVRTVAAAVAAPRSSPTADASTTPLRTGQRHTGWAR